MKELSQFSNVPIIVVSARNNENEIVTVFELGGKDYIHKPFEYQRLLTSLNAYFEHSVNKSNI